MNVFQVGAIRAASSTKPILLKNIGDATVSFAAWYLVGNSIAFGTDVHGVIGKPSIFLTGEIDRRTLTNFQPAGNKILVTYRRVCYILAALSSAVVPL